ncbi:MAG: 2-oxo-tetronate isomerase [Pseudomonadota bacterium]
MIRLAANLSTLFTELPFVDRFAAAADAGFRGVECQFPYALSAEQIAGELQRHRLQLVLFNTPPGDLAAGERGIGGLTGRETEFRAGLTTALHYAAVTGCPRLHVMAGIPPAGADPARQRAVFAANLEAVADSAAAQGVTLLLEPINTRVDVPGYLINSTAAALECIATANRPNLALQFDVYHQQIIEGDVARRFAQLLPRVGHVQIADNPGRHEPGSGEINFPWLLSHIDALGYAGWIGCEYLPAAGTLAGIGWATPYLAPPC